jgi:hypothetical protein
MENSESHASHPKSIARLSKREAQCWPEFRTVSKEWTPWQPEFLPSKEQSAGALEAQIYSIEGERRWGLYASPIFFQGEQGEKKKMKTDLNLSDSEFRKEGRFNQFSQSPFNSRYQILFQVEGLTQKLMFSLPQKCIN